MLQEDAAISQPDETDDNPEAKPGDHKE